MSMVCFCVRPEEYARKQVQQGQALEVRAGLTKPKTPVRGNDNHFCSNRVVHHLTPLPNKRDTNRALPTSNYEEYEKIITAKSNKFYANNAIEEYL